MSEAERERVNGMQLVLVVEDDDETRVAMERIVARNGHRVVTAMTAATAIEALDLSPHVAMIDVMMPGDGNGLTVARVIRERGMKTRIALTTAMDRESLGLAEGAIDAFFRKPLDFDKLLGWLK